MTAKDAHNETRKRTVHYKRAVIGGSDLTLQDILQSALGTGGYYSLASSRREQVAPEDPLSGFRLINKNTNYESVFFGQFLFFESGKVQSLITMDEDASSYDINPLTTDLLKGGDEIKKEFVESILYFGVYKNHVVIVQSHALRIKDFEKHLNHLFTNVPELANGVSSIIFNDKPAESVVRKLEKAPVKSIVLGRSPISSEAIAVAPPKDQQAVMNEVSRLDAKTVTIKPCGLGTKILDSVLGPSWSERLDLKDALDDANLQVKLEITYSRTTTKTGQAVIDSIATSLRDLDDDNIRIDLKGGGSISGSELRLSAPLHIQFHNGLLYEDDLYFKMYSWLSGHIVSGEIDNSEG